MLARLRYVGEYLFGGDTAAYAAAVGLTEHWLKRVLNSSTRFRVSTFTRFAESGVVASEWLFCGTGPMLGRADKQDPLVAYNGLLGLHSRYPLFEPNSCLPGLPKKPKQLRHVKQNKKLINTSRPAARAIFAARSLDRPVVLFLSEAAVQASVAPLVIELIRKKYITGVALAGGAAVLDYATAKKQPEDIAALADVVKMAHSHGVGLGEAIGRWGFTPADFRARSVLAAAYDSGIPATVHTLIGDSSFYACPTLYGAEFAAALGHVSYIDFLVFTAQVHSMSGLEPALFIASGDEEQASRLLISALKLGQNGIHNFTFHRLQKLWAAERKATLYENDYSVVGNYAEVFAALVTACNIVYEGIESYEYTTNRNRQHKPC